MVKPLSWIDFYKRMHNKIIFLSNIQFKRLRLYNLTFIMKLKRGRSRARLHGYSNLVPSHVPGSLGDGDVSGMHRKRPQYVKRRTTTMELFVSATEIDMEGKRVTIVSDGWSDPVRKPLINFLATFGSGPMFLKAENCFGEVKDKFFIAKLLEEVIHQVGDQNVVQVITDNASNCKAAGDLIEGRFPHIYWTSCVVHTLNLALKNICAARNVETNQETYEKCNWITDIHGDALAIKNFIMNHNMRLAIFGKFSPLRLHVRDRDGDDEPLLTAAINIMFQLNSSSPLSLDPPCLHFDDDLSVTLSNVTMSTP
ncbi:unnamed protein product [Brassica napus]|nr:unnamed protein product [Brassica napus]